MTKAEWMGGRAVGEGSGQAEAPQIISGLWVCSGIKANAYFSVKSEDKEISRKPKARGTHLDAESFLFFQAKLYSRKGLL